MQDALLSPNDGSQLGETHLRRQEPKSYAELFKLTWPLVVCTMVL